MTNPNPGYTPSSSAQPQPTGSERFNKHVFVWVFAFLLGGFGVDRFVRGQIGLGIAKLAISLVANFFGFAVIGGIWPLVDFIIAVYKAYFDSYKSDDNLVFVNGNYSK